MLRRVIGDNLEDSDRGLCWGAWSATLFATQWGVVEHAWDMHMPLCWPRGKFGGSMTILP